ncbi:glycine cleavage system protein R [Thioalbus denitrificans]|uniref:Glycine cleavage system transcriptional repressor n=1 Tax=Thioalbus denitrificans TaxID=547122 RepID=A0A369CDH5_9GAMM|nr:ACT domain-containing protein [Thioalbus denitrificans]RCX29864.1 glycine cleavage system transcriptional repressor [Thioalbus denitrificans]
MTQWYMLTLVGKDAPGIVARVTSALYEGGCNLGEASMVRLGGNFTIMLMVQFEGTTHGLEGLVRPVSDSLGLRLHVDRIDGELHHHVEPDVRITVYGADRAGIVAAVTGALAQAGLNITDLASDVGGTEENPIYILFIEGVAMESVEALESALELLASEQGVEVKLAPIDTLVG